MARDKVMNERRLTYERAVALACEVCNQEIEDTRKIFLDVKRVARKNRDEGISKAKEVFDE